MYPRPLILAHRGAHASAPENSLRAFDLARRGGCDGVELDVRRLADRTLVVHHDPTIGPRGRRMALGALDLAGLRRAGGTAGRVPTFDRVLAWARDHRDLILNIEIKEGETRSSVMRALSAAKRGHSAVVTSFDLGTARAVKRTRPSWRVGWINRERNPSIPRLAAESGLDIIVLHRTNFSKRMMDESRRRGIAVWMWGIDKPAKARPLAENGVEAFITDAPSAMVAMRDG